MARHASSRPVSKSRIIGLAEVMERTGYSKSKIHRDIKKGKFPPQAIKLEGSTSAGWLEDQIDDLVESRRPRWNPGETQRDHSCEESDGSAHETKHSPDTKIHVAAVPSKIVEEAQTLLRTGLKIGGKDVYCHLPSGKLLVVVGTISGELLAALASITSEDSGRRGGNRDCA